MSKVDQIERLQNMNSLVRSVTNTEPMLAREINRQLQQIRENHQESVIDQTKISEWANSIFNFYRSHTENWEFKFSVIDKHTGYSPLWIQNELTDWIEAQQNARTLLIVLFGMKDNSSHHRPENTPSFDTDRAYLENYLAHKTPQGTQLLLLIV